MPWNVYEVTPVLETGALADNDVFFAPKEIPQVFDKGHARKLVSVLVLDEDDQDVDFDLLFFNASVTLGTLNQPISISDVDAEKIVGYVRLLATDANDLVNSWVYKLDNINQVMMKGASASLWVGGVVRSNTPSYTASGLLIKLGFD